MGGSKERSSTEARRSSIRPCLSKSKPQVHVPPAASFALPRLNQFHAVRQLHKVSSIIKCVNALHTSETETIYITQWDDKAKSKKW